MDNNLNKIISIVILSALCLGTILAIVFLATGESVFMISTLAVYVIAFAVLTLESCLDVSAIVKAKQEAKLKEQEINAGVKSEVDQAQDSVTPTTYLGVKITKLVVFALLTIFALVLLILY